MYNVHKKKRFALDFRCKLAQAEAFGLGYAWPVVQSVCVPKFSPLGGPVSEILADVTFVTGKRDGICDIAFRAER